MIYIGWYTKSDNEPNNQPTYSYIEMAENLYRDGWKDGENFTKQPRRFLFFFTKYFKVKKT